MTNHAVQPAGSQLCGVCCVAMLTGVDVVEVLQHVGHFKPTKTRELIAVFHELGWNADRRLRVHYGEEWPMTCLVKALCLDQPMSRDWHWVCRVNHVWHDPSLLSAGSLRLNLRPVSYLVVSPKTALERTLYAARTD